MRARELRKTLEAAGFDVSTCFDKESFLELLEAPGAAERLAAGPQDAKASASAAPAPGPPPPSRVRPKGGSGLAMGAVEAPLFASEDFVALDLSVNGQLARFMLDTGGPTCVGVAAAQSFGAREVYDEAQQKKFAEAAGLPSGMRPVSLGSVSLGRLDCGEFLAMPVDMPLPPGCSGVLGLDFLSRFDWELDFPALKVRVYDAPQGKGAASEVGAPVPFDLRGLRKVPLQKLRATGGAVSPMVLAVPMQLRRVGAAGGAAGPEGSAAIVAGTARCTAIVDLGAVTACQPLAIQELGIEDAELTGSGRQIVGGDGRPTFVKEANLTLAIGEGKEGPVEVQATVMVGHPAFQELGVISAMAQGTVAMLGLDVLGRGRLVLSARLGALWMSP